MPWHLVHSLLILSSFLCMGMITSVWQSFGNLPESLTTWRTRTNQRTFQPNALSISGQTSSQYAYFPSFSVLTAKVSAAVMVFSSTTYISGLSSGVIVTGFESSLKYSLRLPRMPSSLLSMAPFWSLIDLAILDIWRGYFGWFARTLCWLESSWNPVYVRIYPKIVFWTFSPWVLRTFVPQRMQKNSSLF